MKIESKIDSNIDSKIDSKVEPKIDSEVDFDVHSKVESNVDSEVDSEVDSKVDSKVDSNIDSKIDSKVDSKIDSKIESIDSQPQIYAPVGTLTTRSIRKIPSRMSPIDSLMGVHHQEEERNISQNVQYQSIQDAPIAHVPGASTP